MLVASKIAPVITYVLYLCSARIRSLPAGLLCVLRLLTFVGLPNPMLLAGAQACPVNPDEKAPEWYIELEL